MARNDTWRKQADVMFRAPDHRVITTYTMEAWCRDNPELCAYVQLHCYGADDIKHSDVEGMEAAIRRFIHQKHPDIPLAFKLYDQRGIILKQVA